MSMPEPHAKKPSLWSRLFSMVKIFGAKVNETLDYAFPHGRIVRETAEISLKDVLTFYEKEPLAKTAVDLLAASIVGMGFFTAANEKYERHAEAKRVVDDFCEAVNLDGLLLDMAKSLVACGNDFWLKITPENLVELLRIPAEAIENIELGILDEKIKLPYMVQGYKLRSNFGGEKLKPEAVIHWRINLVNAESAWGTGLLQALLHTLAIDGDKRESLAWIKTKIERLMPRIFEKYAGPDVLVHVPNASKELLNDFKRTIKEKPEEGAWLFYPLKQEPKVYPVQIDPRTRFDGYVKHFIDQIYVALQTPYPVLLTSPGYLTKATAEAAKELQTILISPIQRYIKRTVEREIFTPIIAQAGFDPAEAKVRLNWGAPEKPTPNIEHLLNLANISAQTSVPYIRPEELRKNLAKFGVELWEPEDGEASQAPLVENRTVKSQWLLQKLE